MSNRCVRAWLALVLIGAVAPVGIGGIVLTRQGGVSASDTAVVRIGSDIAVSPGGSTVVPLEVLDAPTPGVGAITVDIVYDPKVIEPSAWAGGSGWSSVLCNLQPTSNSVRCAAVNVTGASGNSLLTSITFQAVGTPGQCSALEAQVVTFADPGGNPVPVASQSGQVCISTSPSPVPSTPVAPGSEPTPTPAPTTVPAPAGGVSSVQLARGCNPVVSTWPDETDPVVIASSTDPPSAVAAIWEFDQARTIWLGFSPTVPANVTDIFRIQNLDVVFVCVDNDAVLTRPEA